ncbi:Fc.00g087210.m01.CDS01 [Cosmosporella sp. VM-42]
MHPSASTTSSVIKGSNHQESRDTSTTAMVRKRQTGASEPSQPAPESSIPDMPAPTSSSGGSWSLRTQWMFFAVASGACAAFNGVFAKLIADLLSLSSHENIVEAVVRGVNSQPHPPSTSHADISQTFFALNLTFNGIMWTLFTTALARGTSTTQVSIMNTSTNFMLTALLGFFIFSEALPPMWWGGAAFLVVGNVIVGRKDETKEAGVAAEGGYVPVPEEEAELRRKDSEDEDVDLGILGADRSR